MRGTYRRGGRGLAMAIVAGGILALAGPAGAMADSGQIRLGLTPVGQPGAYFDLTMAPGQTRTLAVDVANDGDAALAVRTYAADVYTIVDGGFGARLRGAEPSGTTTWLSYPTGVLQLSAGHVVRRTFTVHVPPRTPAGQFITSLIVENDQPLEAQGAVNLDQFVRQALAVVISVPGPRLAGLTVGLASAAISAGKSVVSVGVSNSGNTRLAPLASFVLDDPSGVEIARTSIQMGTFYAGTTSTIEAPLTELLAPGTYLVHLALADPNQRVQADSGSLVLVIGEPPASGPGQVAGQPAAPLVAAPAGDQPSLPLWPIPLALLLLVGLVVTARTRGRRPAPPR